MTTSITCENAAIAEAVKKAARVAPNKSGMAFDKAAGIVLEVNPGSQSSLLVRACNLDVYYTESVSSITCTGEPTRWRLPTQPLLAVLGTLPIGTGKTVTLTQDGNRISISSGRLKASLVLMLIDSYPDWDMFDSSELSTVTGLGSKLSAVEWAASAHNDPPLCGVHLDGTSAIATDRFSLARVPCKLDLPKPITIPAGILSGLLFTMGDTAVGINGHQLLLAPSDFMQVITVIYDIDYPPVGRVMITEYEQTVEVSKGALLDKLNRANQFAGNDRAPMLKVYFGKGEIAPLMVNPEVGLIGDVIEVDGQIPHPRVELKFTPKNIISAVNRAPGDRIKLGYNPTEANKPLYVSDGTGYESWVPLRRDNAPNQE